MPEKNPRILFNKLHDASSAFTPDSLLREARYRKNLPAMNAPDIRILDPDGDIVRHLCLKGHDGPSSRSGKRKSSKLLTGSAQ